MSHTKNLLDAVKQKAWTNRSGLYVPRTEGDVQSSNWPVCGLCKRDVDAVDLRNRSTKGVELYARCHDKEDWVFIAFPFELNDNCGKGDDGIFNDHVRTAMRAFNPFVQSIA